jgi:hypothetical protein
MIEIFAWRKINNSFSVLTVYIYVEEIIDIVQHENPVNNYEEIKILALKKQSYNRWYTSNVNFFLVKLVVGDQ